MHACCSACEAAYVVYKNTISAKELEQTFLVAFVAYEQHTFWTDVLKIELNLKM